MKRRPSRSSSSSSSATVYCQEGVQGPDPRAAPQHRLPPGGACGCRPAPDLLRHAGVPDQLRGGRGAGIADPLPNGYDPIRFPKVAKERRLVVLKRMQDQGLIDQNQATFIASAPASPGLQRPGGHHHRVANLTCVERKVRDELVKAEWLAPTEELRAAYPCSTAGSASPRQSTPDMVNKADAAAAAKPAAANPETAVALASVGAKPPGLCGRSSGGRGPRQGPGRDRGPARWAVIGIVVQGVHWSPPSARATASTVHLGPTPGEP